MKLHVRVRFDDILLFFFADTTISFTPFSMLDCQQPKPNENYCQTDFYTRNLQICMANLLQRAVKLQSHCEALCVMLFILLHGGGIGIPTAAAAADKVQHK